MEIGAYFYLMGFCKERYKRIFEGKVSSWYDRFARIKAAVNECGIQGKEFNVILAIRSALKLESFNVGLSHTGC